MQRPLGPAAVILLFAFPDRLTEFMSRLSMASSDIVRLAGLITASTNILDGHLKVHNLPPPSFDVDGPIEFGMLAEHPEIERARTTAIEASMELSDLLQGPIALLRPSVRLQ